MQDMDNTVAFLDVPKLEARFFKDSKFLGEILDSFSVTAKNCLDEIELAVKNNNPILLANSSHKLLGSAMNFSNSFAVRYLQEIELEAREQGRVIIDSEGVKKLRLSIDTMQKQLTTICNSWQ